MRVKYDEMKDLFAKILVKYGFSQKKAEQAAAMFIDNSCDGVPSHGLNRFPRFVSYLAAGHVDPQVEPVLEDSFGAFERWNGGLGVGCTNAAAGIDRAMELAEKYGIGCVAMRNTNHWMRGGSYGLRAARAGFMAICWTNTTVNMPSWGAKADNVGNNPLVMAFPHGDAPFVMDGALAQYSYGALEKYKMEGKQLPFPGGYDAKGEVTCDPAAILDTWRVLPIGFWKGSGYSLLLDAIGAALSKGNTTGDVRRLGEEIGLTQVFIAFDVEKTVGRSYLDAMAAKLLADFRSVEPARAGEPFFYPGERAAATRKDNLEHGILVSEEIWSQMQEEAAKR